MKQHLLALVLLVAIPAISDTPKPPEPTPGLTASQQVALKGIEDKEKELQQQWQILQAEKSAIMTEFSKEHAGWYLGPNNTPTKVSTPPAPEAKK